MVLGRKEEAVVASQVKLVVRPAGPEGRFAKQWVFDRERRCLENRVLGVRYQVVDVVNEATSLVHHEGVLLLSRRIELNIVVDEDGAIGLVYIRREKVVPPEAAEELWDRDAQGVPGVELVTGISEYELPHGLASRKGEEAEEEIGRKIMRIDRIGTIKESPPSGGAGHLFFAVKCGAESSGKFAEAGEQIRQVKFFSPEVVRHIPTICGITQAGLWRFRAWGLARKPDDFYRSVAERL